MRLELASWMGNQSEFHFAEVYYCSKALCVEANRVGYARVALVAPVCNCDLSVRPKDCRHCLLKCAFEFSNLKSLGFVEESCLHSLPFLDDRMTGQRTLSCTVLDAARSSEHIGCDSEKTEDWP